MASRLAAVLISALALPAAWAQTVVSAHSGIVHFVEGEVRLAGEPLKLNGATFPDVKPGQTLSTQVGHAEILLTPGVFLRLGRNASFRIISGKLTDTRVEILRGPAMVQADSILQDNRIRVKMGNSETLLFATGLYYFDADTGRIGAFQGKARVSEASRTNQLTGGHAVLAGAALASEKFDRKKQSTNELYAWNAQRSSLLALATPRKDSRRIDTFDLGACPGSVPRQSPALRSRRIPVRGASTVALPMGQRRP